MSREPGIIGRSAINSKLFMSTFCFSVIFDDAFYDRVEVRHICISSRIIQINVFLWQCRTKVVSSSTGGTVTVVVKFCVSNITATSTEGGII